MEINVVRESELPDMVIHFVLDVKVHSYQPRLGEIPTSWVPWKFFNPIVCTDCFYTPITATSPSIEFHRGLQN